MPSGPRLPPILGSIAAHAIFFLWFFAPHADRQRSAYEQLIKPEESHLVWYNFKKKLPDVSPRSSAARERALRAEQIEKQSIVSAPENAPKAPQMIFHPVPQLQPQPVTPLPNIIALAAPPPPQRQFTPPNPVERKAAPKEVTPLERAPDLAARVVAPDLPKLPTVARPFTPPPAQQPKLQMKIETVDAPQLEPDVAKSAAALSSAASRTLDQGSRTLAFRPQPKRSLTASVGAMPDAPSLQGATASSANVAVIGLNPINDLHVALPEGSRRAQFSAGPKLNPNGALSSGKSSGITVPDVTIRGGDKDAAVSVIARTMSPLYNSPSSVQSLHASAREVANRAEGAEDIGRPTGIRVSGAPDPRFAGRQVFSVAIQSPNLTSHVGSWLMWYADRAERTYQAKISPPQPLHKVDPKYVATAVEEHVEGTVRLAFVISADGQVFGVETVKGLDDRLDQSATEALRKWHFAPALREGKPIAVDALVEIPFHLAPAVAN